MFTFSPSPGHHEAGGIRIVEILANLGIGTSGGAGFRHRVWRCKNVVVTLVFILITSFDNNKLPSKNDDIPRKQL
jgi:hypothetical protein